jgi:Tfp pilus assembly protein PilV
MQRRAPDLAAGGRSDDEVNRLFMNRVARRLAPQSQALRSERGAFLVETLVAAVLVAIVAVAMFSAIDGVNQASGRTKGRALAASLAQNDQERLRSMPVSMLSNLQTGETNPKAINGVYYDVASRAQWISDGTSATDCTADGKGADYIKITSSVTPRNQIGVQPVTVTSIVTPAPGTFLASQGSLAVTIVDRNAAGVPNLPVTITGPATATDVTDANGCVFFGYMPIGSYLVTASRSGWVDVMGRPVLSASVNIASQQISTKSLSYDQAGSANVTFTTTATDFGVVPTRTVSAVARGLRMTHSGMPSPGIRNGQGPLSSGALWGNSTDQPSITADNLFPFTSPYGIYAGDCAPNDPAAQTPAQTVDIVQINPGAVATPTVLLPALNLHVTGPVSRIKITPTSSGCTSTAPWIFAPADLNAQGNLKFPGLPYGSYTVCADNGLAGVNARKVSLPATNFLRAGAPTPYNLPVPTSGNSGLCP